MVLTNLKSSIPYNTAVKLSVAISKSWWDVLLARFEHKLTTGNFEIRTYQFKCSTTISFAF